jgi:hypothetical protein
MRDVVLVAVLGVLGIVSYCRPQHKRDGQHEVPGEEPWWSQLHLMTSKM